MPMWCYIRFENPKLTLTLTNIYKFTVITIMLLSARSLLIKTSLISMGLIG